MYTEVAPTIHELNIMIVHFLTKHNIFLFKVRMKPLFQRLEAAPPPPPPPGQGDQNQPVFGVLPLEKRKEEREIARQIFLEQMAVAAEKDRRRKEKAKMARLEEADMLTRTRRE